MLLKVIEDGIETSFEIDTAREADGKRWVQIWRASKSLFSAKSVDEAVDEIEKMLALEEQE